MKTSATLFLSLAICSTALAQTQTVRGKVEDVRQTQGQFFLACTKIPLTSATLNLKAMVGLPFVLQVKNKGTQNKPVLEVVSAAAATKIFGMGNLRFGRADRWQVHHIPGSRAAVFLTATSLTGFSPFGSPGSWLLGSTIVKVGEGVVNSRGQFEFSLQPPTIPALVGVSFTSQAIVQEPGGRIILTNPDCKVVRSR